MKLPSMEKQEKLTLFGVLILVVLLVFFGYRQARNQAETEAEPEVSLPDICETVETTSAKAIGQEELAELREMLSLGIDLDEKSLTISVPYDWDPSEIRFSQVVAQIAFCYAHEINSTPDWTVRLRSQEKKALVVSSDGEKFYAKYEIEWQPTDIW